MKKVLSIALALVMMFAVCVPAFAAGPLTKDHMTDSTAIVKTSTTKDDGTDGKTFTVTFDAVTTIPWGTTEKAVENFTVESHLGYGETLNITVAGSGKMKLTDHPEVTLDYSLSQTAFVTTAPVINPAQALVLNVEVAADDWANAIVGAYSDNLTFTANIVAA